MVKYTGTCTPVGNGNGCRSTGTGVMVISGTGVPAASRITAPLGTRSSSPGMSGVVTMTSEVVGDGIRTACA